MKQRNKGMTYGRRTAIILLAMSALAFGAPGISLGGAAEEPTIEFLNPSAFGDNGSGMVVVSDRAATRPRENPEEYRISAWTDNAPADAGVEFELLSGGVSLDTLDGVSQVGPDTFDYNWNIPPTMPDGPYTLRATLFSQNEAIDHVDTEITIVRLGDKAEIDYPLELTTSAWPGGASFGTFRPLAPALPEKGVAERGKPIGNIEASHTVGTDVTSGTTRVRAFYTTSAPGTLPKWVTCGTEKTPGHPVPSSAANDGIRCTLESAEDQTKVTAVAVLANSSPGEWQETANQAGDAIRVLDPYAQKPSAFGITSGNGEVLEKGTNGSFPCHTIVGHLADQRGREIAGANIDVHVTGPSDKLRLDLGLLPDSDIKPADRNHSLTEPGHDCFGGNDQASSDQSEHQILGGADIKHAEADVVGTSDTGDWGFSFKVPADQVSAERYSVNVVASVDEKDDGCHANDDILTLTELWATAAVGLDKAATSTPDPTPPDVVRCDRLRALRTLTLDASRERVKEGRTVDFSGTVVGASLCTANENVKLRRRKNPKGIFRTIASTSSDAAGSYTFENVRVRRTLEYRTVTARTAKCVRAASNIVKVEATSSG